MLSVTGMSSGSRGLFEFMWKPSGNWTLQGDTNLRAGRNRVGFDDRRELRLCGASLRDEERRSQQQKERETGEVRMTQAPQSQVRPHMSGPATCRYFTSLSRITPGGVGSDDVSTEPFTGGRSW